MPNVQMARKAFGLACFGFLSAVALSLADPDFDAPKNASREVPASDARAGCLAELPNRLAR
jgi:hypothetical protein